MVIRSPNQKYNCQQMPEQSSHTATRKTKTTASKEMKQCRLMHIDRHHHRRRRPMMIVNVRQRREHMWGFEGVHAVVYKTSISSASAKVNTYNHSERRGVR